MPETKDCRTTGERRGTISKRLIVPALILAMAAGIVAMIAGNWNAWASEKAAQQTDDAYTRADLTPLSTCAGGTCREGYGFRLSECQDRRPFSVQKLSR